MSQGSHVACVVLNSSRRDDTLECLRSLVGGTYGDVSIEVLDCQSTDGSVEAIREAFPQVSVVELAENLGYAGNNNVGIRRAVARGADWVFVLNEDTVLAPDCLETLVAAAGDPSVGIVGPMVYHHDEPGVIQSAGGLLDARWAESHRGQNEDDRGQYADVTAVDWISGCAILVRREVVEAVGVIDERFFIYWEETEWCIRARKAGWTILHVPAARIWHKGVQRDYRPKPSVTYYSTRNRLLALSTHRAPFAARALAWTQILRTLASWSVRPKWRHKREHRHAMWRGVVDFLSGRAGRMPV
ncbi:MAG: glycosyltransferase family 2 protein [Vicinamibacterales bacterium]